MDQNYKVYVFHKKIEDPTKKFTHYWTNDDDNFPDPYSDKLDRSSFQSIENYLASFTDYEWQEQPALKINQDELSRVKVEWSPEDNFYIDGDLFVKQVWENPKEVPIYYSSINVDQMQPQVVQRKNYAIYVEIDYWSTFGLKIHQYILTRRPVLYFIRCMMNRFIFGDNTKNGLWFDYNIQTYLRDYGINDIPLIKNINSEILLLEDWIKINGGFLFKPFNDDSHPTTNGMYWLTNMTSQYKKDQSSSDISFDKNSYTFSGYHEGVGPQGQLVTADYSLPWSKTIQSFYGTYIKFQELEDKIYNSNGLYRWIPILFGNNITTGVTLDSSGKISETTKNSLPILNKIDKDGVVTPEMLSINCNKSYLSDVSTRLFPKGQDCLLFPIPIDYSEFTTIYSATQKDQWTTNKVISLLNSPHNGFIIGNGSLLNCLINEIPPLVISTAIRYRQINLEEFAQSIGSILSTHYVLDNDEIKDPIELPYSFFGIVADELDLSDSENPKINRGPIIPTILTDTSYIPIILSHSSTQWGQNQQEILYGEFWKKFESIFTGIYKEKDAPYIQNGNLKQKLWINTWKNQHNTFDVEPVLYGPKFYNWTYKINTQESLSLTADMVDWHAFINNINVYGNKGWQIILNTVMSDATYYRLYLRGLQNSYYNFSKSFAELSAIDKRSYPFTTESYNNWLQTNATSTITARDNQMRYYQAEKQANMMSSAGSFFSSLGAGASAGAMAGPIGLGVGAGFGLLTGLFSSIGGQSAADRKLENEQKNWAATQNSTLNNMYGAPAKLDFVGFGSGSLLFSSIGEKEWSVSTYDENVKNNWNLFFTYNLTPLLVSQFWNDIKMNGYFLNSSQVYNNYNNRVNFNYMVLNLSSQWFELVNMIKEQLRKETTIFSQKTYIDWFRIRLEKGIRLWKMPYDVDNFFPMIEWDSNNYIKDAQIIADNIEIDYRQPSTDVQFYVLRDQKTKALQKSLRKR